MPPPDSTFELVRRAKEGDSAAVNELFSRYLPSLRRWARGRLPHYARDLMDTDDLVQETVMRAIKRLDGFEQRHDGALQAYLRQAVVNRIRDEVRRDGRSPEKAPLDEAQRDSGASPLEEAIGREAVERYEQALSRLREEDRQAIIARVELDHTYSEIARALGKPSPTSASIRAMRGARASRPPTSSRAAAGSIRRAR